MVEFKRLLDHANREVDDVLKAAWYEFRHHSDSARGTVLDTVIVVAVVSVLLVVGTTPAVRELCRDILLTSVR